MENGKVCRVVKTLKANFTLRNGFLLILTTLLHVSFQIGTRLNSTRHHYKIDVNREGIEILQLVAFSVDFFFVSRIYCVALRVVSFHNIFTNINENVECK